MAIPSEIFRDKFVVENVVRVDASWTKLRIETSGLSGMLFNIELKLNRVYSIEIGHEFVLVVAGTQDLAEGTDIDKYVQEKKNQFRAEGYRYIVFGTVNRIVNETATKREITIQLPEESTMTLKRHPSLMTDFQERQHIFVLLKRHECSFKLIEPKEA